MNQIQPDIVGDVRFYSEAEGGRREPTSRDRFGCLFRYGGELFDCQLLLEETGPISPGQRVTVPIKLLQPDLIKDILVLGQPFQLWDMRVIAQGQILEVREADGRVG